MKQQIKIISALPAADAKRTGKWLSTAELQLLGGKRFPGLNTNLLTKEQFVKSRSRKILTFFLTLNMK